MPSTCPEADGIILLSLLHSQLMKKIDNQLSVHGISFTEYLILRQLNDANNKTMRRIDLAESIGKTASGVTRILAPMEKIKLVDKESNPRDARISLVKLSKAGERVLSEASVTFLETAKGLTEPLSENQLEKLTDSLRKLM